ncbi:hypothetical protein D0861_08567 [Hortaea werneckii]|uniref:GDP/GTP exchange factor Sec2 N-terminal domain-containing protein n=1 Tax=Hortaea werneckii TaxID=91943 RepID=A0A3M7EVC8_HORWE|nr:hypothetical protein D0861_08567 [Hortaea werneckii]
MSSTYLTYRPPRTPVTPLDPKATGQRHSPGDGQPEFLYLTWPYGTGPTIHSSGRLPSTSSSGKVAEFLPILSWSNAASTLTSPRPPPPPSSALAPRSSTPQPQPTAPRPSTLSSFSARLVKSTSSPNIHRTADGRMATIATASPTPVNLRREHADDGIMDTRTGSPVQRSASSPGPAAHLDSQVETQEPHKSQDGSDYKPDLSAEVAMLSTKLVNAINYQTNLDDSLQATRHELEHTQAQLSRVSQAKAKYDDDITNGILVKKAHVDAQIAKLREELAKEKAAREASEKSRKQTEGELENLTTALFEEANGMVAAARKDTEAAEKRNSHLRSQLSDTEELLASQQGQLQDLKTVMERMERASSEQEAAGHRDPSVPSTPINPTTATWDALQFSPNGAALAEVPPNHPLHFSQLLVPVMRNDVSAYADFQELLASARRAMPHSRGNSGSTHKLASASQPDLRTASSPVVPGAFSFGAGLGISNASGPSSSNNSPNSSTFGTSSASHQQSAPLLKETKFYKRTLTEDLEPTLRLDLAPGLSFLSRRTVLSALLNGTLAVEPFLPSTKFYGPVFACALCAESRKSEPYVRKHRFRTSESDDAQRYPLCDYCLNRIRAVGDFLGFLRMLRDGHWRCESEAEARGAWEEATRLRERMFWARLGGGVVPAVPGRGGVVAASSVAGVSEDGGASPITTPAGKSARQSLESIPERRGGGDGVAEGAQKVGGGGGGGDEQRQDPDGVPVVEAKTDVPELVAQPTPQHARRRSSAAAATAVDQSAVRASPVVLATGAPEASHQLAASKDEEEAAGAETQALDGGGKTSVEHPQLASESTSQPLDDGNVEETPEQPSKDLAPSAVEGGNGGNAVEESPVDKKAPLDDELQTASPPPEKKEESPRPDVEAEDAARSRRGEEMWHEEASKGDDEEPAPSQPSAVEKNDDDDDDNDEQVSATSPSAADAVRDTSPTQAARADDTASVSPPSPAAETPDVPIINEPEPSPPLSSPPQQQVEAGHEATSASSSSSVPEQPPSQPAQQESEQEHQASDPPPSSSSSSSAQPDSLPTPTGPQTQTTKPEPRRPSGVMARVKAMEAKAQAAEADKGDKSDKAETKLPGAFE